MTKNAKRLHRKIRIRARISGTKDRPRLAVFRSNKALYVQVIDDKAESTMFESHIAGKTIAKAKELGTLVAATAKKKNIKAVVFDRGGYRYHGAVKALAEAVREGGIRV